MIGRSGVKRFWFAGLGESPWEPAIRSAATGTAPVRAVTCESIASETAAPGTTADSPPFRLVGIAWFRDVEHLAAFDAAVSIDAPHHDAVETVRRGARWLDHRWRVRGPRSKHMAFAQRRAELSAEEFARRWAEHAGRAGATPIPEAVRGDAYAQNAPLDDAAGLYHAINEVWFDDPTALAARVRWFDTLNPVDLGGDLFGQHHLLALTETPFYFLEYA